MKTIFSRLLFGTVLVLFAFHPVRAHAQNQQEMNRQAEQDFSAADADMTKVYKELVGNMSKPDLEELKAAQRQWLQFRDAQAKYEADLAARGGSLYPTIYDGRRAAITKARTAALRELLNHG